MNGFVAGGWAFVWAAYALTGIAFLTYGVMVVTRVRKARRSALDEGSSQ